MIRVDPPELSYWSVETHNWVVADEDRPIFIGSSSRDIRLEARLAEKRPLCAPIQAEKP
jgi:hypothetical protein